MSVSPDHWGKGLGKRLLHRGLEEVDKAGQYDSHPVHIIPLSPPGPNLLILI